MLATQVASLRYDSTRPLRTAAVHSNPGPTAVPVMAARWLSLVLSIMSAVAIRPSIRPYRASFALRTATFDRSLLSETPINIPATSNPTIIFVVDNSSPGSSQRIDAVKGAVLRMLPASRISVVSCFYNSAELTLEPTNSVFLANRFLPNMHKCVKGNLAQGIGLGLAEAKKELQHQNSVLLAIVADGKAHGLMAGSHNCELDDMNVEQCDNSLYDAAMALSSESLLQAKQHDKRIRTVVIDTAKSITLSSSEEGLRLATACNADYLLRPNLSDSELMRFVDTLLNPPFP